ncbi:hypothetical protein TRIATDRAFT_52857 [Trichoderma atroviride IMI 206040]|uniref:Uncharacterized protein n=1 Tax=Hypocrea atroviridis (strain ATCC 20476 / IMI 206040) TaxID=452589 RepID=G9NFD0_HYPAI|nr:uncharacterized protein TRIATDRAFT_52857 [Trichoderma atroviride IMI 206040]EHK50646.1 hypothetical protein TRIATDRAFT_52857 [Trichoderma atroviride IMI 206040]
MAPNDRASRRRKNQDISGPDDTSTSDAASKKAKAEEQRRREKYELDYVRLRNGQKMELPFDEDFCGVNALPHKRHWMRLQQRQKQVNSENPRVLPKTLKAPAPWVPDPTTEDISNDHYGCEDKEDQGNGRVWNNERPSKRTCRRSNVPPKPPKSQEFIYSEDESDEEELPEHIIRKTPPTFMGIPREIRMKIYRHLLLSEKPITVHGGWKQVHRNNQLSLPMSILRTCQAVHDEACVVLYGENVFVYLLRDPIYPQRAILDLATNDDVPSGDNESDSGSEYEDEEGDSLFCNDHRERCIDVDKYAHLFRKIVVEAEHNRYSKATQESMAEAIRLFANSGDTCNIRTLTVRISPLWNEEGYEPAEGRFTFIDFFEPNTPVHLAIKALDCQMVHVEILTRYMSRQSSNSAITWSEDGSVRLTVNRRWERFHNVIRQGIAHQGVLDERDEVMQLRMREMTNRTSRAIDELARHVEAQCNERNFHQDTTMGLALNWPNINFDDFEDMDY